VEQDRKLKVETDLRISNNKLPLKDAKCEERYRKYLQKLRIHFKLKKYILTAYLGMEK
jgi:hypothetical protein